MFDADEGESICIIDLLPTLESITVLIGIASTVITHTLLSSSAIGAVLVISVFTIILDLIPGFYDFEALGKVYRPGTTTCFYCGLLVPVAELLTRHSAGNNECFGRTVAFCGCVLIVLLVRNLTLAADTLQPDDGFTSKFSHSFFISIAFALLLSIISYFVWNIAVYQWLTQCFGLFLYILLDTFLPFIFPRSFSLGECAIVSQTVIIFIISLLCHTNAFNNDQNNSTETAKIMLYDEKYFSDSVIVFSQIAFISCLLFLTLLLILKRLRNPTWFYLTLGGIICCFSIPSIVVLTSLDPLTWMIKFILLKPSRIYLFLHCSICTSICFVVIIKYNGQQGFYGLEKKNSYNPNYRAKISTRIRKIFHLIAIAIYLPAIWIDPEFLVLAANCALIGFLIIESVRSLKIQPFGSWLREYLEIFIDEKDQGNIILTHIYLLVGFTCPLWLYGSSFEKIPPAVLSGVLSLGIGDTAAAVVGSKYGVRKWPGSNKSLEGTTAAILFQIIAIMILKLTGIMQQISVFRLFTAIVMTSFLEAFTAQIDNIVLPLYMYVLLI